MRSLVAAVAALVLVGPAAAHNSFKEGPKSARLMAATLNKDASYDQVTCRYRLPHVLCNGVLHLDDDRSDVWYRFTMTVHKTAPKKGFAVTCLQAFGFCRRSALTFST